MIPASTHPIRQEQNRGFVLITTYLIITVLSVLSIAFFARSFVFMNAAERNRNRVVAFNMAEAALHEALSELKDDAAYAGTGGYASMANSNFRGGFDVEVIQPPESPNPDIREITTVGYAPSDDATSRGYEKRESITYVHLQPTNPFLFSIFAESGVQINGEPVVDSYDSTVAPYDGTNASQNGDVGTNSTETSAVTINGEAVVEGDVIVGPGGDPDDVILITGNAQITGNQTAAPVPKIYPSATTPIPSSGDLILSGNINHILTTGIYHFDSIQITGNARITAVGPVTIFVDGPVSIGGNGISTSGNQPPNLLLFMTSSAPVRIVGNADLYAAVYAPKSPVLNGGNGEIYGAVVSDTYHQTGDGNIHYDEALSQITGDHDFFVTILSWLELNTGSS